MLTPPKWPLRILRFFLKEEYLEEIEGDMEELFQENLETFSVKQARRTYAWDTLRLFRISLIKHVKLPTQLIHFTMIRHNFLISWRRLVREKGYTFLNVGGLALGLAVTLLIGLWIWDELSFNSYHENYPHIAQVMRSEVERGEIHTNTSFVSGLGHLLKESYSDYFEEVVMVRARLESRAISSSRDNFTQDGYFIQAGGPSMLSLDMKYGSQEGLTDPTSILLSASLAQKIFGDVDPTNQIVTMDAKWELSVTGVYHDLPKNTTFKEASYFAPLDLYFEELGASNYWDNYNMYIYVQMRQGISMEEASRNIKDIMKAHQEEDDDPQVLSLHPMSKWHLYSTFDNGKQVMGDRLRFIWFYAIIGMFVLSLACINFINLSTARSEKRAKEVGIRKSIGSNRMQLIVQFLSEALLISVAAFLFSLGLVYVILPWFNEVAAKDMVLPLGEPGFLMIGIGITLITALLAGSYPAFYLSSFIPVKVLKGTIQVGKKTFTSRKVLVVFQFTVAISLTIGTLLVYQQIQHAKNRSTGYERKDLLMLRPKSPEYFEKFDVLVNELRSLSSVQAVGASNYPITNTLGWNGGFSWTGKDPGLRPSFNTIRISPQYAQTLNLEFVAGQELTEEISTGTNKVLINEAAAEIIELDNPVGEFLHWEPDGEDRGNFQIIGVVKDMVKGSPFEPVSQSIMFITEAELGWLFIRLNPAIRENNALAEIRKRFNEIVPSAPFDYVFVEDSYATKFGDEERISMLSTFFTGLALLISCLGLFGLSSYVAERRTKEIGIRKVLGASILNLWQMLSKDFVLLVLIACLLASPIAYFFLQNWLESYPYRIEISWWIFIGTYLGALALTLVTISYQALKAANTNPVECLRAE